MRPCVTYARRERRFGGLVRDSMPARCPDYLEQSVEFQARTRCGWAILLVLCSRRAVLDQHFSPIFHSCSALPPGSWALAAASSCCNCLAPCRAPASVVLPRWPCGCRGARPTGRRICGRHLHLDAWPACWRPSPAVVLAGFPGRDGRLPTSRTAAVMRIGLAVWIIGVTWACCLASSRSCAGGLARGMRVAAAIALALTIFVPRSATSAPTSPGRLLGRHKMSPVLESQEDLGGPGGRHVGGDAGGGAAQSSVARSWAASWRPSAFGLTVGLAGVLGDLAESLIKRDCQQKDASQVVPGFGGVLDVVDSDRLCRPGRLLVAA